MQRCVSVEEVPAAIKRVIRQTAETDIVLYPPMMNVSFTSQNDSECDVTRAHDEKSFMTPCGYSLVLSTRLVSWRDASVLLQRSNNGERSSLFGAYARHTGQSDQFNNVGNDN